MTELNDHELLAEFARTGSEAAFATLTARHVNLVYSVALRFTCNPHHAEEITQAVFIILARKAGKLSPRIVLSGWLYQTARLTAANFVKGEIRRQHREQEAYMQSTLNETDAAAWEQIAPLLDEAMGHLGETDRNAVVLRFFENQTAAQVAATLKLTEAAAHKRVNRALEKLRKLFTKRGVMLSATLIAGAVSASSVQAAPAGLVKVISAGAMAKGMAAGASTLTLVKVTIKTMTWLKVKFAMGVGAAVLLTGGTVAMVGSQIYQAEAVTAQTESIDLKIERLNHAGATVADALRILGEPAHYASGTNFYSQYQPPANYSLAYTNGIEVVIQRGLVMELRSLRPGPGFSFHGKLRLGSTLDEVLKVVGQPKETSSNQPAARLLGRSLAGKPDVLYTEIGGKPGTCLYWRPDQGTRFLFKDDRVIAMVVDVPKQSSGFSYQMADDLWQLINGVDKSKLIVYASIYSSRAGVRPSDMRFDIQSRTKGLIPVGLGTNGLITDFPHDEALRRENPAVTVNESDDALTFSVWATMPVPENLSFRYKNLNDMIAETVDVMAKAKKKLIRPSYVGYVGYMKWLFSSPWEYRVRGVVFRFPKNSTGKATIQILTSAGAKTYGSYANGEIHLPLDEALLAENPLVRVSEKPLYIGPDLVQK